MNQIIIHLSQWFQQNPTVNVIIYLITLIGAFIWCLKVIAKFSQLALKFIIKHQHGIEAFFKKLENLAKILSYVNVFNH